MAKSLAGQLQSRSTIANNFLSKFRDKETRKLNKFTAVDFLDTWNHFDTDGNGFIEDSELDRFLEQFITSVIPGNIGNEVISKAAFEDMRKEFLAAYDDNSDNRIEIGEMAQILPIDEEFLVLFQRDNPLRSSVEFMKIWKEFDKDCSGFIEANELNDFIKYLLIHACAVSSDIDAIAASYSEIMLKLFDFNGDGKLQLSEMARLMPIKENYIAKPIFKNSQKLSFPELDRIFKMYDVDGSGQMDNEELKGLLKDLLEICEESYNDNTLLHFQDIILTEWDVNHDGKISKKELKMILIQHTKLGDVEGNKRKYITLKENIKNQI